MTVTKRLREEDVDLKQPSFTRAPQDSKGRPMPQAIAHRGYKALYPENTMAAFEAAVEMGAHALETDLHLSKDGEIVLSHDPTLSRVFGEKGKVVDYNWDYLKTLRTRRKPHEPMVRLRDLLEWLGEEGKERDGVWVLLDVKLSNDLSLLFKNLALLFEEIPTSKPWNQRILIGCWGRKCVPLILNHLPTYHMIYIGGVSLSYARTFLAIPNFAFNMTRISLSGPCGSTLIADVKAAHRSLFSWTVNERYWMRWAVSRGLDGVLTDDPGLFREVCEGWDGKRVGRWPPVRLWGKSLVSRVLGMMFWVMFQAGVWDADGEGDVREEIQRALEKTSVI